SRAAIRPRPTQASAPATASSAAVGSKRIVRLTSAVYGPRDSVSVPVSVCLTQTFYGRQSHEKARRKEYHHASGTVRLGGRDPDGCSSCSSPVRSRSIE